MATVKKESSFLNEDEEQVKKVEEVKKAEVELTDVEIIKQIEDLIKILMKKKGDKYIVSIGKLKGCIEKLTIK